VKQKSRSIGEGKIPSSSKLSCRESPESEWSFAAPIGKSEIGRLDRRKVSVLPYPAGDQSTNIAASRVSNGLFHDPGKSPQLNHGRLCLAVQGTRPSSVWVRKAKFHSGKRLAGLTTNPSSA